MNTARKPFHMEDATAGIALVEAAVKAGSLAQEQRLRSSRWHITAIFVLSLVVFAFGCLLATEPALVGG